MIFSLIINFISLLLVLALFKFNPDILRFQGGLFFIIYMNFIAHYAIQKAGHL